MDINMNMNINMNTNRNTSEHQHHRPKSGFSSARDLIAKNKLLQRDPALGELRARRNTMCEKIKIKTKTKNARQDSSRKACFSCAIYLQ
jgi:hypothetical protein